MKSRKEGQLVVPGIPVFWDWLFGQLSLIQKTDLVCQICLLWSTRRKKDQF